MFNKYRRNDNEKYDVLLSREHAVQSLCSGCSGKKNEECNIDISLNCATFVRYFLSKETLFKQYNFNEFLVSSCFLIEQNKTISKTRIFVQKKQLPKKMCGICVTFI